MKSTAVILSVPLLAVQVIARTVTVYNGCPFTMWPAMYTAGDSQPDQPTGWEAAAYTAVTFSVPDDWSAARIWGRRECNFDDTNPATQCVDGGCVGGLLCQDPGVPPATLAEFTLGTDGNPDYYDISLVDGYNLPLSITNGVGCNEASCPVDLGPNCPAPLQGPFDSIGFPVGCKSACNAGLDDDQGNSPNCCTGNHSTPATCPPSGVEYYSYFKDNCPDSYAYAYDESSGTALWLCDSNLAADYTVTFCPPPQ